MKIKNNALIKRLFAGYQDGTLSNIDKQLIDNWFSSHHEDAANDIFSSLADESRIHTELTERLNRRINDQQVRRLWRNSFLLKAACITAVLSVTAILVLKNRQQALVVQQFTYQTITTQNAQIKNILLDDGTRVWLNSASRIRFAQSFNTGEQRTVYLDKGEAYFEVKHDTHRPFAVLSGRFQTTVLGTAFNIRAYNTEKEYKVAVASGMVSVGVAGENGQYVALSKSLIKGQILKFNPANKKLAISQAAIPPQLSWIAGRVINIDGLNLRSIGEELARAYNLKVSLSHPEYDRKQYTVTLNHHNLALTLQQLTLKTGVSYKLENDHLTINPQNPLMK